MEDLDYADDLALLSHRVQDMRDKTQALKEQGAKVGLKINATKTKMTRICTKGSDGAFIEGEQGALLVRREVLTRKSRHAMGRQRRYLRC